MQFAVPADAYDRYMGRYSQQLAPRFADFAGVAARQRVLDVGCGPGALSAELVRRTGADRVAAADPTAGFAATCAERIPGADVRCAPAEALPWADASFDAALAQLVLAFMTDPDAGAREMRRTLRPGGVGAACTWDLTGRMDMLRTFWDAARALEPDAAGEQRGVAISDPAVLRDVWLRAGFDEVTTSGLLVEVTYADFDDFWGPFLTGTGPAGGYCASLDPPRQVRLRDECFLRLGRPAGSFVLTARAWAVRGSA
jgi:SAM-dependent methyltransferase